MNDILEIIGMVVVVLLCLVIGTIAGFLAVLEIPFSSRETILRKLNLNTEKDLQNYLTKYPRPKSRIIDIFKFLYS